VAKESIRETYIKKWFIYLATVGINSGVSYTGRLNTKQNALELSHFTLVEDLYLCHHNLKRYLKTLVIELTVKKKVCKTNPC